MKHYGANLENGSQIDSGNLSVQAGNNLSLSTTSVLAVGIANTDGTTGLVITTAQADPTTHYLDASGREQLLGFTTNANGDIIIAGDLTVNGETNVIGDGTDGDTTILGANFTVDSTTHTVNSETIVLGDGTDGTTTINGATLTITAPDTTMVNLTLSGFLTVEGNTTLGNALTDTVSILSNNITLPAPVNFPVIQTGGTILGINASGQVGSISPNSFSVHSYTGTGATDATVKANFIEAFNTAGTTFGGITIPVGTTIDTGDIILLTNGATTPTVEQYLYTGADIVATAAVGTSVILDAEIVDISHATDVVENISEGDGIRVAGSKADFTISARIQSDAGSALENVTGTLASSGLDVADSGIVTAKLADDSVSEAKVVISNTAAVGQFLQASAVAGGVTTMTWASPAGNVQKYAADFTVAAAATSATIAAATHGLTGDDFIVQVYDLATANAKTQIIPNDIVVASTGAITIDFGLALSATVITTLRIVVLA